MRFRIIAACAAAALLSNCSFWYSITKKESTYYTEPEKKILEETTSAINFKYGFDPDLEVDYVYRAGHFTDAEIDARSGEMKKALLKFDKKDIIPFYEKMFKLTVTINRMMEKAKEDKEWPDYTLIQKYLLPDMEKYLNLLEKNVLLIDQQYKNIIDRRKGEISKQVK